MINCMLCEFHASQSINKTECNKGMLGSIARHKFNNIDGTNA